MTQLKKEKIVIQKNLAEMQELHDEMVKSFRFLIENYEKEDVLKVLNNDLSDRDDVKLHEEANFLHNHSRFNYYDSVNYKKSLDKKTRNAKLLRFFNRFNIIFLLKKNDFYGVRNIFIYYPFLSQRKSKMVDDQIFDPIE